MPSRARREQPPAGPRAADSWLHTGPLRGSAATLEPPLREALALLSGDPAVLTGGLATTAVGLALTLGELATGVLLVLFVLIAWWAFRPANRERFERDARIPLDSSDGPEGGRQ